MATVRQRASGSMLVAQRCGRRSVPETGLYLPQSRPADRRLRPAEVAEVVQVQVLEAEAVGGGTEVSAHKVIRQCPEHSNHRRW